MKNALFAILITLLGIFIGLLFVDGLEYELTNECKDCLILPYFRNL